jgi:hypothetical protein
VRPGENTNWKTHITSSIQGVYQAHRSPLLKGIRTHHRCEELEANSRGVYLIPTTLLFSGAVEEWVKPPAPYRYSHPSIEQARAGRICHVGKA